MLRKCPWSEHEGEERTEARIRPRSPMRTVAWMAVSLNEVGESRSAVEREQVRESRSGERVQGKGQVCGSCRTSEVSQRTMHL